MNTTVTTPRDTVDERPAPRQASDRYIAYAAVSALIIESIIGTTALLRDVGPELLRTTAGHHTAGESPWISLWEMLQIVVAISLIFWALLLARRTPKGLFGAAITQGIAIGLSGYHVLHTLPDSWGLIVTVTITTALLSTRAVREWCLGPSDHAFTLLIANHHTPSQP
jgi:hypothetical protein